MWQSTCLKLQVRDKFFRQLVVVSFEVRKNRVGSHATDRCLQQINEGRADVEPLKRMSNRSKGVPSSWLNDPHTSALWIASGWQGCRNDLSDSFHGLGSTTLDRCAHVPG